MYHEPLVRLAKSFVKLHQEILKRVTFGLTGSDANDGIIKFARAYTGRPYIISYECISWFNLWCIVYVSD